MLMALAVLLAPSVARAGEAAMAASSHHEMEMDAGHCEGPQPRQLTTRQQATALSYLAEDAVIFEGGSAERSKAEYAAHHLGADAAFSQAVPSKMIRRRAAAAGNMASIASEGRTTGTYKGRQVDRVTTETMVLRRTGAGWKIAHIHWSSAAAENK